VSGAAVPRPGGRRIAVVALGSLLEGDDGAGPAALAELVARFELPPEVEALELGTLAPDLAESLRVFAAVLILATVRLPGAEPGSVVIERDPGRIRSASPRTTRHDSNLAEALDELALEGRLPEDLVVIGVVPKQVGPGTELSPEVEVTISCLAEAAAAELERLDCSPRRRASPLPGERWWGRVPVLPAPTR